MQAKLMEICLFCNLKLRIDVSGIVSTKFLKDRLVKHIYKFAESVT